MSYIKLHRSLLHWEWYDDHNATRLLVHLLLSVNYQDKDWKGITISKGSMATSWQRLSTETGLSVKACRVAMDKLERAGEVARKGAGSYQLVSLMKWDKLQIEDENGARLGTSNGADKGQAKGRQRATTKESKEGKEIKEEKKTTHAPGVLMTEKEHQTLVDQHGADAVEWMVHKLSNYKMSTGKKYKSDYHAINAWVIRSYTEQARKPNQTLKVNL